MNRWLRRGGTFIAVEEDWKTEMHKTRAGSGGWGKYATRELLGRNGASMVVVSLYLPGAWDWQTSQQMLNLRRRLGRHREAGTLDKQDKAVLGHLEQLGTLPVVVGAVDGLQTQWVWHCWAWHVTWTR